MAEGVIKEYSTQILKGVVVSVKFQESELERALSHVLLGSTTNNTHRSGD